MISNPASVLDRHEHRVLALMLIALHTTVWWGFDSPIARPLMLVHLGLFLLWQPLLNREQRIDLRSGLVFATITVAFVAAVSWVLTGFWQLLLIGLVSGRVNVGRRQRYIYLAALIFLVLEFLIGTVPRAFSLATPGREFVHITGVALLAVPAALLLLPGAEQPRTTTRAVDLFYGAGLAILTLTVGLGALVLTLAMGGDYPVSLIETALAIAVFLLAIAWLWAPIAGFSGLGQLWERYVQNIGTPFEEWLGELERNAREASSPERFLDAALEQLEGLSWVSGLEWEVAPARGALGRATRHLVSARSGPLHVTLYAYRPMGTTLMLHARLLIQLVAYFFVAKQREQELSRRAHLQAIYETGARVTHDIKNLLQSLTTMSSALENARGGPGRAEAMVARQLPHLTQRLRLALEKLQSPSSSDSRRCPASQWWRGFTERYAGSEIGFECALEHDPMIPVDLFDSVAENLIDNARFKHRSESDLAIGVRLESGSAGLALTVTDSGSAVPAGIAGELFNGAVSSNGGLGIGLYQAARQAERLGYALRLAENRPGAVRFELSDRAMHEARTEPSRRAAGE